MCSCGSEPETSAHFLFRPQNHKISRSNLLNNVYNLDQTQRNYDDDHLIHTLLYGSKKFNFNLNKKKNETVCRGGSRLHPLMRMLKSYFQW